MERPFVEFRLLRETPLDVGSREGSLVRCADLEARIGADPSLMSQSSWEFSDQSSK